MILKRGESVSKLPKFLKLSPELRSGKHVDDIQGELGSKDIDLRVVFGSSYKLMLQLKILSP